MYSKIKLINEQSFCNEKFRPYVDIRILHTYIIDDPFDDPKGLIVPDHSPERLVPEEEVVSQGLTKEDLVDKDKGKSDAELDKERKRLEAQSRAVVLEMIGDLPDADVKPPENVLFVCQLNPITEDEDLKMIFFRFGVKSCEVGFFFVLIIRLFAIMILEIVQDMLLLNLIQNKVLQMLIIK